MAYLIEWNLSKSGRAHDPAYREVDPMRSREACVGAKVRVSPAYRKPSLRGVVGTVETVWGEPLYAAVEVRLDDGRSELLWRHEVEPIHEEDAQGLFTSLRWS
jgi:hypothetical protein